MTSTKDKVQKSLSEVRTLVLGAQILLGFQYQALFRPRFEDLLTYAKILEVTGFALIVTTIVLLIAPSSFHRLCEDGEATSRQYGYTTVMIGIALNLFVLAIAANVTMTVSTYVNTPLAVLFGLAMAMVAVWF